MRQQTESIFSDYGSHPDWDMRVGGADAPMTDACQFGETDHNYLHRRWAAAGWHYWYEHSQSGHKLVLSDDSSAAAPIDGSPDIRFQRHGGSAEEDGIGEWSAVRQIMPASVALSGFDFKSAAPASSGVPTNNAQGDVLAIESYEYAGAFGFKNPKDGQKVALLRMEEMEAGGKQFDASGNNRYLMPGRWFRLSGHFSANPLGTDAQAREFLVTDVHHSASNNYQVADAPAHYGNTLSCVRKSVPWRPGRSHSSVEPTIYGLQTAIVVGPPGEEIHTDEYGRVRVQFHWDRVGENDEKSSAWVRVATAWSGPNFGMTSIPRIGAEVIVQFLGGSPDRPIITGMVPNAKTMPPWTLPANKTQSGILTRSTPGGAYNNANALRFEDKKGKEQLWLHAEKDQLTEVEHDEDKWVGNDRRKTIDRDERSHIKRDRTEIVDRDETITIRHDRTEIVDHDETITIHHDRVETVDNDERITIHNNRSERVDHNERISIGDNRDEDVGQNETVRIGDDRRVTIGGHKTETISLTKAETIGLAKMLTIGGLYQTTVGAAMNTTVALVQGEEVGLSKTVMVGTTYSITAGDELSITVGKASLLMKADDTIVINGHTFSVGTTDEQSFKADGNITMKAKKILEN